MGMNRRGFLGVVGAAAVAPKAAFSAPRDDSAYLQGLIDKAAKSDRRVIMPHGTFYLHRGLTFPPGNWYVSGSGSKLIVHCDEAALMFTGSSTVHCSGFWFELAAPTSCAAILMRG